MPDPRQLYEPMLERDLDGIRSRARDFAGEHGTTPLFHAVSRFAALAFNPSQHGRHAFLATLSAWDVRELASERWVDLLAECAVYVAEGRLPWSEAPPLEPPPLEERDRIDREGIQTAIRERDRALAERWLGARASRQDLRDDFFFAATTDLADLGHPLIVSVAAWKLSLLQDSHPSFAALRPAAEEWTAKRESEEPVSGDGSGTIRSIVTETIDRVAARGGDPESFHDLALLDAALEAAELGAPDAVVKRAVQVAAARARSRPEPAERVELDEREGGPVPIYPLARDWGALLKAYAIAGRMERRFPSTLGRRLIAAAEYNLRTSSFDQWSFA